METEQFQIRDGYKDITDEFDKRFDEILMRFSLNGLHCEDGGKDDRVEFFKRFLLENGGAGVSKIENWIFRSPYAKSVPFSESLYVGWEQPKLYFFSIVGKFIPLIQPCCAPVIKINGELVSSDKFGHFVSAGYEMYYQVVLKNQNYPYSGDIVSKIVNEIIDQYHVTAPGVYGVFDLSNQMEIMSYGLSLTGVYSYADIVSNYEGFRFWQDLVDGPKPYFECNGRRWVKKRVFSWKNYVNAGWDEAINCNNYTGVMWNLVRQNIGKKIQQGSKTNFTCPVEPQKCATLVKHYGPYSAYLINPKCAHPHKKKSTLVGAKSRS